MFINHHSSYSIVNIHSPVGKMKTASLSQVIELAGKLGHLLVATVGPDGMPHIAAAGNISQSGESVEVTAWFCPATVENLRTSKAVALVIWDAERDLGYQLLGLADQVFEVAQLDGYLPDLDERLPLPQVARKLLIRVTGILEFKLAPHSDIELDRPVRPI
jgi:hypothetical protein